ncbi:unnamed protein product [Prunus armeniaca]|uniref:Protein MULTIPOLAR SPINDLE 1 n=1 Tax=Prunus armeniaca TaxID=36596 RepID=A0A6J5VIX1_PRUAR|nr:unnamed protein product [Prunus armeniaca]CAB4319238.1 unnamed protein product [Prunus armeniaca]
MSGSEQERATKSGAEEQSLRVAVAISLLRSKLLQKQQKQPPPPPLVDQSDALRWKRKAKERKQELLRLRQHLNEAEDASQCDLFPQSASCKCYFFDNLGKLSPNKRLPHPSQCRFNDVLRRRFLRHVRFKERRRRSCSSQRRHFADINSEDEMEQLRASVDFLVELCETSSPVEETNVANWSHQAADFILASMKNLLSVAMNVELIEGIISSLITRLVRRMCCPLQGNASKHSEPDAQFFVQHLIRKLGSEPYIGQRALFLVSQRISVLAENFLFADPFDDAFTNMHQCMFMLIQLTEFLVSDYLSEWSKDEGFDTMVFEEWVASMVHARKALQVLESRNGVYVLYMERVIDAVDLFVTHNLLMGEVKQQQKSRPGQSKKADMLNEMKPRCMLSLSLLLLLLIFCQSLPSSAHEDGSGGGTTTTSTITRVVVGEQQMQKQQQQPLLPAANYHVSTLLHTTRKLKLGVHMKLTRSVPKVPRVKKSSAIPTLMTPSLPVACFLSSLSLLSFFLL